MCLGEMLSGYNIVYHAAVALLLVWPPAGAAVQWLEVRGPCMTPASVSGTPAAPDMTTCRNNCGLDPACRAALFQTSGTCTFYSANSATKRNNFKMECYAGAHTDSYYMEKIEYCKEPAQHFFEGMCYDIVASAGNWAAAESACVTKGGHLVSIPNTRIQKFLLEKAVASSSDLNLWIGYRRVNAAAVFSWSEPNVAPPAFIPWLDHWNATLDEPHLTADQLCVYMMYSPGVAAATNVTGYALLNWADDACSITKQSICQYQPSQHGRCRKALVSGGRLGAGVTSNDAAYVDMTSSLEYVTLGTDVETAGYGAWTSTEIRTNEIYVQFNMPAPSLVLDVHTQGRNDPTGSSTEWVRSFNLTHSLIDDVTATWTPYVQHGQLRTLLRGNDDRDTIRQNQLPTPLYTRHVRLYPVGYTHAMTSYSLRAELYGCSLPNPATATNILLGATSVVHMVNYYNPAGTKLGPLLAGLATLTDGNDASCKAVPTSDVYPSWPLYIRFTVPKFINSAYVRVVGWGFPCQQAIQEGAPLMSPVSVRDDLSIINPRSNERGKMTYCTYLHHSILATSPTNGNHNVCYYYCEAKIVDFIWLTILNAPASTSVSSWSVCEVSVYDLE